MTDPAPSSDLPASASPGPPNGVALARGAGPRWSLGPVPGWVEQADAGLPCAGTALIVLHEQQRNHRGPQLHEFTRLIFRMRNEADVKGSMLLRFPVQLDDVDVVVHTLNVFRGSEVRSRLHQAFTTTTPSQMRSEAVESGPPNVVVGAPPALLHHLFDLEVGDYLEVAHTTIYPRQAALGDLICGTMTFCWKVTVERMRLRLVLPRRPIAFRYIAISGPAMRRTYHDFTDYIWSARDVPALPEIHDHERRRWAQPHLEYSELPDWETAVRLMRPLYECDDPPPEIAELAAGFARAHPSKRAQVLAVMRYVQDEFAYEAFDTRESPLRPKPLARILAERATDCKGKTLLMLALLRALGVEAAAVFVNEYGMRFKGSFVSLTGLNHMIVMVTVDGREYFVDPSARRQRGDLDALTPLPFLQGLPLIPHRGPVEIPHQCDRPTPQSDYSARYRVGDPGKPTLLRYRHLGRGLKADAERTARRGDDPFKAQTRLHSTFARIHPSIDAVENLVEHDDEAANTFRTTADLRIASLWRRDPAGELFFDLLPAPLLDEIFVVVADPLALHHRKMCISAAWTSTLDLPFIPRVEGGRYEQKLRGLEMRCSTEVQGSRVTVHYSFKLCTAADLNADAVLAEVQRIPTQFLVRIRPPAGLQTGVRSPAHAANAASPRDRPDAHARPGVARPFRPRFR